MDTKQKLISAVKVAFNYGLQQRSNRAEPIAAVLSWCGYNPELPKPFIRCLYEAYKLGKIERDFQANRITKYNQPLHPTLKAGAAELNRYKPTIKRCNMSGIETLSKLIAIAKSELPSNAEVKLNELEKSIKCSWPLHDDKTRPSKRTQTIHIKLYSKK